jgi:FKBP-type peptidyl-prolyl cis-trans isomerase
MSRFGAFAASVLALFVITSAKAADMSLSPEANQAFLAANAKKPGVQVRPSGLQYSIISNGFGKSPKQQDSVDVYYSGSLINGKVFDKTDPPTPAHFIVNQLIPGWTEALTIMREGDHWQLVVPPNLGYGPRGAGGIIPPNQTLVFDMQLLKVTPAPKDEDQDQNPQQ